MFFKNNFPSGKYSELDPKHILSTLDKLRLRIGERFPGSGLGRVAGELNDVAVAIVELIQKLSKPLWSMRLLTVGAIVLILGLFVWLCTITVRYIPAGETGLLEILQGAESAINEIIFLTLAIIFFATLENRIKRKAALQSLHRLRSIAHVVDMHQLTKDPAYLISDHHNTQHSPERNMTPMDLTRYLDYCSELLAINSKLAALHAQYLQDSEVMKTVEEVESLSHDLSSKIWQKIMMLDVVIKTEEKAGKHGKSVPVRPA